jgi:hypothetical protein
MDPVITHIANHGTDTEPSGYVNFADRAKVVFAYTPGVGLAVLPPSDGLAGPAHARIAAAALADEFPAAK